MPQPLSESEITQIVQATKSAMPELIKATVDKALADCVRRDDVQFTTVLSAVEKQAATIEKFAADIRKSRKGPHVAGMEDVHVSIPRIFIAAANGGMKRHYEEAGAGEAFELMKQYGEVWKAENAHLVKARMADLEAAVKAGAGASVINDLSFGNFIPDQVAAEIIAPLYALNPWIALEGTDAGPRTNITVLSDLPGPRMTWQGFETGVSSYFRGEDQSSTESGVGTITEPMALNAKAVDCFLTLNEEYVKWGTPDSERFLNRDIVESMSNLLSDRIPFGKGGKSILGFTKHKGVQIYKAEDGSLLEVGQAAGYGSNWAGKALDYDILDDMQLAVAENKFTANPWSWVMASRARSWLSKLKTENYSSQTTGQPYMVGLPLITAAKMRELIGNFTETVTVALHKPGATLDATLPAGGSATKFSTIFGGGMYEIIFGRWPGIELKNDDGKGTGMKNGKYNVRATFYCDLTSRYRKGLIFCPDAKVKA